MMKIDPIYYSAFLRSIGGMQSVLKQHLTLDEAAEINSHQVIFFESPDSVTNKVTYMGLKGYHTISQMRRDLNRLTAQMPNRLSVYHNFWGAPFLAEVDHASRRIGYIHTNPPWMGDYMRQQRGLIDGVICVSQPLVQRTLECLPELTPDRVRLIPLPIPVAAATSIQKTLAKRPFVIGYSGRLIREMKRVHRLPEFWKAISVSGVEATLEILGDGPESGWLQRQFSEDRRIIFHGACTNQKYWNILSQWDAIIFVSDTEGTPISLLEALGCGVLPIFPCIHSGGDAYAERIGSEFVYPSDDFSSVAKLIRKLQQMPESEIQALRKKCHEAVAFHDPKLYIASFKEFLEQIASSKRISKSSISPRPCYWSDHLPFGFLSRFYRAGLIRRNDAIER